MFSRSCKLATGGIVGTIVLVAGIVLMVLFPGLIEKKIKQKLVLQNGTEVYKKWAEPPVPAFLQFRIFNVTNGDEAGKGNPPVKAKLQELGPYTYRLVKRKDVQGFNHDNGTVDFNEYKTFYFDEELSVGSEDDLVTFINIPLIVLTNTLNQKIPGFISGWVMPVFNGLLKQYNEQLFTTKKVRELLFEGYEVKLLKDLVESVRGFGIQMPDVIPNNRFGLQYGKNGTHQGLFKVYTGETGSEKFNHIKQWKGNDHVDYWGTEYCNRINGTDGTSFGPLRKKDDILYIFNVDLCRSLYTTFSEEVTVRDIPAYRFTVPEEALQSPLLNENNKCFCFDSRLCHFSGALPIATCKNGAPIVITPPHFYQGDVVFREPFIGLKPEAELHQTFIDVEPLTGLAINGAKRIQINVHLQPDGVVDPLKGVEEMLFPVMWANEYATIDEPSADNFKKMVMKPKAIGTAVMITAIVIGSLMIFIVIIVGVFCNRRSKRPVSNGFTSMYTSVPQNTIDGQVKLQQKT